MKTLINKGRAFCSVLAVVTLLTPTKAHAVDTAETFAPGLSDAEFYLGADGSPVPGEPARFFAATVLGYGVMDRFSGYLGFGLDVDERLTDQAGEMVFGVFGTPLSFDHFELDLFFDVSAAGQGFAEFAMRPAFELNFNADPQMQSWGLFLLAAFPIKDAAGQVDVTLTGRAGAYYRVHPRHEILAAYRMSYHTLVTPGTHRLEHRDIGLGYNITLSDNLELITDAHIDVPQDGEQVTGGGFVGFVATLPTGG